MYFLIILAGTFLFLGNMGAKINKAEGAGRFLNLTCVVGIASVISWVVTLIMNERITADMFLYAVPFAVLYVVVTICMYRAYEIGSMIVTALFGNAQLLLVALFGIIVYNEPLSLVRVIGIVGILVALVILTVADGKDTEKRAFNFKWLLFCVGIMLGNTLLSILSKVRQSSVGGENPFAYMALCYTFTFIASVFTYTTMQMKNRTIKTDIQNVKDSTLSLALQGVGNSGANLLSMFLISHLDVSVVFPVSTGVSLVLTVIYGSIILKEKQSLPKVIGSLLGIASIVILNM